MSSYPALPDIRQGNLVGIGRIPDIKKGRIIRPDIQCIPISVVDPKLFFSNPDSDPIFVQVLDSDPDPL
jgi:hypothetical protein